VERVGLVSTLAAETPVAVVGSILVVALVADLASRNEELLECTKQSCLFFCV
jgi:hypothetical protein